MPWKKFKNFKSDSARKKFSEVCRNIGESKVAHTCIDYILDRLNCLEHLVLLIEILSCDSLNEKGLIDTVMDEFLGENYWKMDVNLKKKYVRNETNEEWFQDSVPGLYESAIEIKIRDVRPEDEDQEIQTKLNLKIVRYNILCTCFVTELIGCVAMQLKKGFQRYILRSMHKILEKAGSSKFIIRSAGLHALNCVAQAMDFKEVSELISEHSDFILFNVKNQLKRNYNDESFLDMLSVVFKFSNTSIAPYVEDIIETVSWQLTDIKFGINYCAYLKLFNLYACSVQIDDQEINLPEDFKNIDGWDNFLEQCFYELNKVEKEEEIFTENIGDETNNDEEIPENISETKEPEQPLQIQLILKILTSSLSFFASTNPSEVILVHEIFENALPTLHKCDDKNFLPTIHKMWYPFTKQFQGSNYVVLQHSFRLLTLIASLAKDFVYKSSTEKVIPTINSFLISTCHHKNVSYTQEFKLQKEILNGYGQVLIDLGIEDKMLDENINIILKYHNHQNEQLAKACQKSIDALIKYDPVLLNFKFNKF